MVFQGGQESSLDMSLNGAKKLTPGPYRATKLWNGIVRNFREKMLCKKHRRHLRTYNDCFTASESIDFLHELLKKNPNIGKDVTRQQTIQLLRKFLKNHVIEDVQGRWGSENFEDDGRLFRFPPTISIAQALRQPLGDLSQNAPKIDQKSTNKKQKRKSAKISNNKENDDVKEEKKKDETAQKTASIKSSSTTSTSSFDYLKRPLPPVPAVPKCRVISQPILDEDVQQVWKSVTLESLRELLRLDTLEDIVVADEIDAAHVQNNATKIGRSGVVQVDKEEDLPYWALSAMTCLANWPNGKDTGLPCYPGFERDVFKAVSDFYSGAKETPLKACTKRRLSTKREIPNSRPEPLLTFHLYELFTNILCLLKPESEFLAISALRYALLLLPSVNRRKLHLLLRLMSKMCSNPHLTKLGGRVSTRTMLLQTFSRHILSCNEEVYLDELLAMRLVTFLIDHHAEVMKVPDGLEKRMEEKLSSIRRSDARYDDSGEDGAPRAHYLLASPGGVRARLRHRNRNPADRQKRKSVELMKSWDKLVTTIRSKPSLKSGLSGTDRSDSSDNESYVQLRPHAKYEMDNVERPFLHRQFRQRTHTVGSRVFGIASPSESEKVQLAPLPTSDIDEPRMKPAKSCSDICEIKISPYSNKLSQKSSDMGSSWNLRLRPSTVFGKPFSRLRKSKV